MLLLYIFRNTFKLLNVLLEILRLVDHHLNSVAV